MARLAPGSRRIYGRVDEIATLRSLVGDTANLPRVVEIQGGPGAGKSTVWLAGIHAASEAGLVVLQSRPVEAEAHLSFAGLRDLIDAHFDKVASGLPEPQRRALAVALLRERAADRPQRSGVVEAAFLRVLHLLAADHPVLVAVDDLQWLDRPTRRVVEFAARRLGTAPIAIVLTRRAETDSRPPSAGGHDAIDGLTRDSIMELGPLSLGAIHAVLTERFGNAFPRSVLRRIHEASRGNPFVALEIGRLVHQGGALRPTDELPLPNDIREVIEHRLQALSDGVQRALAIAAALSEPTTTMVRAAGGDDLGPAEAAGIVVYDGDRVRFAHPLFASSVYQGTSPLRRRRIHRRLAALAPSIEERARHLALATAGPDDRVADELERAAAEVFSRGAVDAAAELIARACVVTPPGNHPALHRRRIAHAEYSLKAGDTGRAREAADAATMVAPPGTPRAEALFYRGRAEMFGADWQVAEDLFGKAASEPRASAAIRSRIQLAFAQLRTMSGRSPRDGLERARSAARLAAESGRDDILCEALCLQAKNQVLLGEGDPEPLLRRAETLQEAMAGLWVAQWPLDVVAAIREWQDDLPAALAAWTEICRLADEHGDESSREWTLWRLAHVEWLLGAWPAALAHLEEGHALALQAGRQENEAIYSAMRAFTDAHLGRVESAREHARRAVARAEPEDVVTPSLLAGHALGLLELSQGNLAEAHRQFAPLTAWARANGIVEPGATRWVADDVEALIGLGHIDAAVELLTALEARAERLDRASARAAALRCRGLLLGDAGSLDEAIRALEGALAQHDRVSLPFERARTLLVLGRVARRSKARRHARDVLTDAELVFSDLGASVWAASTREELDRIPGRQPSRGGLTPTETRVAHLLAEGHSTSEVAAAMFVTPKTVETYASRIYAKLDVHSRAGLISKVAGDSGPKL